MTRIAHCCCGSLRAEATGEPALVGACHCLECQRRTGSPFGVSTYFPKEQVRTEGPSTVYVRGSDSGRKIENSFLPRLRLLCILVRGVCAGPYRHRLWRVRRPVDAPADTIGVGDERHPWVTFDHRLDRFAVQPEIDKLNLERPLGSPDDQVRAAKPGETANA